MFFCVNLFSVSVKKETKRRWLCQITDFCQRIFNRINRSFGVNQKKAGRLYNFPVLVVTHLVAMLPLTAVKSRTAYLKEPFNCTSPLHQLKYKAELDAYNYFSSFSPLACGF